VPRSVYTVLRRALSPRPADRFDSLSMFLTALRRAVAHQPLWRRALSLVAGVHLASVVVVGLISTAIVFWITERLDTDKVVVTARLPPIDAAAGLGATDAIRSDATSAPLPQEQRRALELDALRAENRACAEHAAGCPALLDHLARCCLDTDIEGIALDNEARFSAGAAGLADRFLAMCDAGNAGACVASAFAYVFGFHDVSMAEGELVPRFIETMRKGCLGGAAIGCAVIQGTYADMRPGVRNDGGIYDPATNTWRAMSTINAPAPRADPVVEWTGTELVVFGGATAMDLGAAVNDGGRYDPVTDTWRPLSTTSAPAARISTASAWLGDKLIVWGNFCYRDGFLYDPVADAWSPIDEAGAPSRRQRFAYAGGPRSLFVWGGSQLDDTGAIWTSD